MWVRSRPGRKTRWRGLWTEEALCVPMWAGNANEWLRRMSRSRAGEWFVPKEILFTRERVEKIRQQRNSNPNPISQCNGYLFQSYALPKITYANIFYEEEPERYNICSCVLRKMNNLFFHYIWTKHKRQVGVEFWRVRLGLLSEYIRQNTQSGSA